MKTYEEIIDMLVSNVIHTNQLYSHDSLVYIVPSIQNKLIKYVDTINNTICRTLLDSDIDIIFRRAFKANRQNYHEEGRMKEVNNIPKEWHSYLWKTPYHKRPIIYVKNGFTLCDECCKIHKTKLWKQYGIRMPCVRCQNHHTLFTTPKKLKAYLLSAYDEFADAVRCRYTKNDKISLALGFHPLQIRYLPKSAILRQKTNSHHKCAYCGIQLFDVLKVRRILKVNPSYKFNGPAANVEHLHATSLGGHDVYSNIVLSCTYCNSGKGVKPASEYYKYRIDNGYRVNRKMINEVIKQENLYHKTYGKLADNDIVDIKQQYVIEMHNKYPSLVKAMWGNSYNTGKLLYGIM